tara:strand:+ start:150 stop:1001 length:852 start_codon:yes stop_codon:yes gene_type:complete
MRKIPAEIEYHGSPGITAYCLTAITRLLQFGDAIRLVWLLSCRKQENFGVHCFILNMENNRQIAIKSGFSSGYGGEGPKGLSTAIEIFLLHAIELEEFEVDARLIDRVDKSLLTSRDIESISKLRPIHITKTLDYLWDWKSDNRYSPLQSDWLYPPSVNFGLLDERIFDLGLELYGNPDYAISTAFKRLEDALRTRAEIPGESGLRLIRQVFEGEDSKLYWDDDNRAEHGGKTDLFKSIFLAYRNPRAHKELKKNDREILREFMLVNELFLLEASAVERPVNS